MFRIGTLAVLVVMMAAVLTGAGCTEKGPKSSGPPAAAEPDEALVIGIVMPFGGSNAVNVWIDDARMQEAPTRSVAKFYRMEADDAPARQAELLKQAAADGCSAIVVLPFDPAALVPAVAEVRKEGIPVVLLDQAVPSGEGLPPATLVAFEDETIAAKKIVDAAVEDAKNSGFPAESLTAVILSHDFPDARAKIRQKSMRDALTAAGVRVLPAVNFVGFKADAAKALNIARDIYPNIAMVICDDDNAIRGATECRHVMDHKKQRFVVAGFVTDPELVELSRYNIVAALVDRKIHEPMKSAYATALALARGETVAAEIHTPEPFYKKTGPEIEGFFPPYVGNPDLILGKQADPAEVSKSGGGGLKNPPTPPR